MYSSKWFKDNPDKASQPGVLYVLVLVHKKTFKRECIKIGITKGTTWKDAIVRSKGFGPYDIRIQKIYNGTLEEVYNLEQTMHQEFANYSYSPVDHFGGHTECFTIDCLPKVLEFFK